MSASAASSLLTSAAAIALPAAGLALSKSEGSPDPMQAATWMLGGLAFLAGLAYHIVKLVQATRGTGKPGDEADSGGRGTWRHRSECVTRGELQERLTSIEEKIDRNNNDRGKDLKELTDSMHKSLEDLILAVGRLQGKTERAGK